MKIEYKSVEPNLKSLNYELIFTFDITDIGDHELPHNIIGELYSEDDFKLSDLLSGNSHNNYNVHLNAKGASNRRWYNNTITLKVTGQLSEKAVAHIENYRLNQKEKSKDVVFKIKLHVYSIEPNIEISNFHLGNPINTERGQVHSLYYRYDREFSTSNNNLWILSGGGSATYLTYKSYPFPTIFQARIDLMDWVNNYTKYLNIGEFFVYEFLKPEGSVFNKALKGRYDKAQQALKDMQKQLNYWEWKHAIIASRPIVELFNNFDDFKKFLLEHEYSEEAYNDLKKTINGFFDLLSKFYHALKKGNADINPEISANREDAYMAYSFCVTLLHLISQKAKRKP